MSKGWAEEHLEVVAKRRAVTHKHLTEEQERKALAENGWCEIDIEKMIRIERRERENGAKQWR